MTGDPPTGDAPGEDEAAKAPEPEPALETRVLAVLPLRGTVPMPGLPMPLAVGRPFSLAALSRASREDGEFLLLMQRRAEEDEPDAEGFHEVGVTARLLKSIPTREGSFHVVVQAMERAVVDRIARVGDVFEATVQVVHVPDLSGDVEAAALSQTLRGLVHRLVDATPTANAEIAAFVDRVEDPAMLADIVANTLELSRDQRQQILEIFDVRERLREVAALASHALEVAELGQKIQQEVHGQLEEAKRQAMLREQLKAIRKEMGEEEDPEVRRVRERIAEGALSPEAKDVAERELHRLESMSPASPERGWIVNYLDWLVSLPWTRLAEERRDLEEAARILDREHFGLFKAKERILEALAVRRLNPEGRAPLLCFVGPPGTGKTSLAQAVAEATGRELVRISVGGVSDESEIRGHRRTYVGSMPGRIISGLRKAGTRNPVYVVDEIDKMASSFHGDPASALLEVLDPEQNARFVDRYIEVPFDLSRVLFITTANTLATMPRALVDRLEVIEVPGYTEEEKVEIALRHLFPRQREAVGFGEEDVAIDRETVRAIIRGWTEEAGVRNLERHLASILRKLALRAVREEKGPWSVGETDLVAHLGPRRHFAEAVQRMSVPGVAMGLAWTPVGGKVLFIEAAMVPGPSRLTLTGSLGDVMKESAVAALTWLRSHLSEMARAEGHEFHIHVPAGAVPKDGPSAGLAILAALASAITGRLVRHDTAVSGEITLRGKVLPVGGVRDKVLGAARAGVKAVVLPRRNEADLEEVPEEVRRALRFRFVEAVDEVLDLLLETAPSRRRGKRKPARTGAAGPSAGSSRPKPRKPSASKKKGGAKKAARRKGRRG